MDIKMDLCERLRAYSRECEIDGMYVQAECLDTAATTIEQLTKQRDEALDIANRLSVISTKYRDTMDKLLTLAEK